MKKNHIDWIDTLKGLGIFLVVLGHRDISPVLIKYIYSFHMPLFFFISGFLLSREKYTNFYQILHRKFSTLIIPYIIFSLLSILALLPKNYFGQPEMVSFSELFSQLFFLSGKVTWNTPLWFLVSLFTTEIIYFFIYMHVKNRYHQIVVFFTFLTLGYYIATTHLRLPFGVDIALVAIIFYWIGNIIRNQDIINIISKKYTLIIISSSFIISFLFGTYLNNESKLFVRPNGSFLFGEYIDNSVSMYNLTYGNYIYFYISAFAGILFLILFSQKIKSKPLSFLGRNTLLILSTHYFIFWAISVLEKVLEFNYHGTEPSTLIGLIDTVATLLISLPMIYIVKRYLPVAIGKKQKSQITM